MLDSEYLEAHLVTFLDKNNIFGNSLANVSIQQLPS